MTNIIFETADGSMQTVDAVDGTTIMQTAVDNGIEAIVAECGGACSCATCHCYIEESFLTKLSATGEIEQALIDYAVNPQPNSRLSCQILVSPDLEGMIVRLPESQY